MRTKHARAIRNGILARIVYNDLFDRGYSEKILQWWFNSSMDRKPSYQCAAFLRTTMKGGKVYTGNKFGVAFMNPSMRRRNGEPLE